MLFGNDGPEEVGSDLDGSISMLEFEGYWRSLSNLEGTKSTRTSPLFWRLTSKQPNLNHTVPLLNDNHLSILCI